MFGSSVCRPHLEPPRPQMSTYIPSWKDRAQISQQTDLSAKSPLEAQEYMRHVRTESYCKAIGFVAIKAQVSSDSEGDWSLYRSRPVPPLCDRSAAYGPDSPRASLVVLMAIVLLFEWCADSACLKLMRYTNRHIRSKSGNVESTEGIRKCSA
jgi:hypothetical protein